MHPIIYFFIFAISTDCGTAHSTRPRMSSTVHSRRVNSCSNCHSVGTHVDTAAVAPVGCDIDRILSGMMIANVMAMQLNALAYLHFNIYPHSDRGYITPMNSVLNISVAMRHRSQTSTDIVRSPITHGNYAQYQQYRDDPRRPSTMSVASYSRIRRYLDNAPPLRSHGRLYSSPLTTDNVDRHNSRMPLVSTDHIFDRFYDTAYLSSTTTPIPPTDGITLDAEFDAFSSREFLSTFRNTIGSPCLLNTDEVEDLRYSSPVELDANRPTTSAAPDFHYQPVVDMNDGDFVNGLSTLRNYYHDATEVLLHTDTDSSDGREKRSPTVLYCECHSYDYSNFGVLVRNVPVVINRVIGRFVDGTRNVSETDSISKSERRFTLFNDTIHHIVGILDRHQIHDEL